MSGTHHEVVRSDTHFAIHEVSFSIAVSAFTFVVPENQVSQAIGRAVSRACAIVQSDIQAAEVPRVLAKR